MKRIASFACAALSAFALLAVGSAAFAQEAFAPLIQQETNSIVKIDLSKIDAQQFSTQLQGIATDAVDYFVADKEKAAEAKKALPLVAAFASQYFDQFVQPLKDAGVADVYVVVDQSADPKKTLYPYVAIPTAKMSEEQVKEARAALTSLNKTLENAIKYRFARNGFIYVALIPNTVDEADAKTYVKERFAKTKPVEKPEFAAAFAMVDQNAVVSGAALAADPAVVEAQIDEVMEQLESIDESGAIKEFVEKIVAEQKDLAKLAKYGAWELNLADRRAASYLKANSAADSATYVEKANAVCAECVEFVKSQIAAAIEKAEEQPSAEQKAATDKLIDAIAGAVDATFGAVKADGDVVSFVVDGQFFDDNKPAFDKITAAVAELSALNQDDADEDAEDESETDDEAEGELDLDSLEL